jgi:glycosyltransferase involved in cell wall biosynthesis
VLKPLRAFFETLERQAVLRSSATLAVCEALAVKVRPWAGVERVTVLPDVPTCGEPSGYPVESLREIAGRDVTLGLYVGNLERYQGIDLLFESLRLLDASVPFRMVMIGGEPRDVDRWRSRAELQGLSGRVHFLGKRPLEHLASYLDQADMLVSPRLQGTNTPMKISYYMQAGRAILATDIYSHTQVLDAECALLVSATPTEVAAGMQRLVEDVALRTRLGEAARAKAGRECSPQAFRTRLLAAYERALLPSLACMAVDTETLLQWVTS